MKYVITFLSCVLLMGCGPVYQTGYEIIPPKSEMGRMCANNCLMAQTNCTQACEIQKNQCREIERLRAESDYNSYVAQQSREGRVAKRELHDFYRMSYCDQSSCDENCQNTYHICHTNCGGNVIPYTYCSAFCED